MLNLNLNLIRTVVGISEGAVCPAELISTTSIMGYYKFDGDYTKSLGEAFFSTPTANNMDPFVTGLFGQAASFNGVNSWLAFGNNNTMEPVGTGGWTFSTWLYFPTTTSGSIWDKRTPGSTGLRIVYRGWSPTENNLLLTFNAQNLSVTFNKPGGTGLAQWIHICVRQQSGTNNFDCYINGTLEGTVTRSAYTASGQNLNVGRDRANNSTFMDGYIDEWQVWDRSLTNDEVTALAAGTCPLTTP